MAGARSACWIAFRPKRKNGCCGRTGTTPSAMKSSGGARVLALARSADVPAIVLKGWPLAEMLHASPALRLIADMDVLVPPDRRTTACVRWKRRAGAAST
jgi:hypothetical protein